MLDAPGILEWVKGAKPGDIAVYARGAAPSLQVAKLAASMCDQELVDLTRRREGAGWRFLIQRRSAPFNLTADRQRRCNYGCASAETIVLRMVEDAIRLKQPCPTNREFADEAGLSGALAASYRLRKLVRGGKIALIDYGPFEHRVAVLISTGKATRRAKL